MNQNIKKEGNMKSAFISCSLDWNDEFVVSMIPSFLIGWNFTPTIRHENKVQNFDTYTALCNAHLFVGVITIEEQANTVWREYLLACSLNIPSLILFSIGTVPPDGMDERKGERTIFTFDKGDSFPYTCSIYRINREIKEFLISTFDLRDSEKIHSWSAGCYFLMDLLAVLSSNVPYGRNIRI